MATAGLALIGFMERAPALHFLQNTCVPDPAASDPTALEAAWQTASGSNGPAVGNAGQPDIQPIPTTHAGYVAALQALPWVQEAFNGQVYSVELVEIEPLLAFQFHVDTERSEQHCGSMGNPPSLDEKLNVALPLTPATGELQVIPNHQSLIIRSRSLNFRTFVQGMLTNEHAGIHFKFALPLVQVVRFNGRCYLYNGYHRCYGLRMAGATHVPCIVRDVPTAEFAGIRTDWGTFPQSLLESADPPTVGHFTQKRATEVQLRRLVRVLHVSWADYVMPEE